MSGLMLAATAAAAALAGLPAEVTPAQAKAQQADVEGAPAAAAAARPKLLALLDDADFRRFLKADTGATYEGWTAQQLLDRMRVEYSGVEVVHNWSPEAGRTPDVTLATATTSELFYNEWQLLALGLWQGNTSDDKGMAKAEHMLFRLPALDNASHPSMESASNRLLYGAANVHKLAGGNPMFGSLSFVFDNAYIKDNTAIAAVDTGLFLGGCIEGYKMPLEMNCSAWQPQQMGTFDHFEHSILSNIYAWNQTSELPGVGDKAAQFNLAQLVGHLLNTDYDEKPETYAGTANYYTEANPLMNVRYHSGIKALLAHYTSDLFGTGVGDIVRQWAIKNDWVMLWMNDAGSRGVNETKTPSNKRFIDPYVLRSVSAGRNCTSSPEFARLLETVEAQWAKVNTTRPADAHAVAEWYSRHWEQTWATVAGTELQAQPSSPFFCSSLSCAAVRVVDKSCVCRV